MKMISFAMTTRAFENGEKDVTRRCGWRNLRVGEKLMAVDKLPYRANRKPTRQLGIIEVTAVDQVQLDWITADDVRREGFANMTPAEFVTGYCKAMKCNPDDVVTRIEFRKLAREEKPNA